MKRTRSVIAKIPAAPPATDWSALPREMVREVGSHLDLVSLFCLARATRDNFDTLVSKEATSRFARFIPDPAQWDRAIAPFLRPLYLDHEALLTMEPAYFRVVKRRFCEPFVRLHSSAEEKTEAGMKIDWMISFSIANYVDPVTDDKHQRLKTLINRYIVPGIRNEKKKGWSHFNYFVKACFYCNVPFFDWLRTESRWAILDQWKLGVGTGTSLTTFSEAIFNQSHDVLPACAHNTNGLQVITAFVDFIVTMNCSTLFWRTDCFWATMMSAKHVTLAQLEAFFNSSSFKTFKEQCWIESTPMPILLHPFQIDLHDTSDLARYTLMLQYIPEQFLVGLTWGRPSYVEFLAGCVVTEGDPIVMGEISDRLCRLNARSWISISPKEFLNSAVLSLFVEEHSRHRGYFVNALTDYWERKGKTFIGDLSVLERPFKALSRDCQRVTVHNFEYLHILCQLFGHTSTAILVEHFCKWADIAIDYELSYWIATNKR
jgi:hypothetical protein